MSRGLTASFTAPSFQRRNLRDLRTGGLVYPEMDEHGASHWQLWQMVRKMASLSNSGPVFLLADSNTLVCRPSTSSPSSRKDAAEQLGCTDRPLRMVVLPLGATIHDKIAAIHSWLCGKHSTWSSAICVVAAVADASLINGSRTGLTDSEAADIIKPGASLRLRRDPKPVGGTPSGDICQDVVSQFTWTKS